MNDFVIREFDVLEKEGTLLFRRGVELIQELQSAKSQADLRALIDSTTFLLRRLENDLAEMERTFNLKCKHKIP